MRSREKLASAVVLYNSHKYRLFVGWYLQVWWSRSRRTPPGPSPRAPSADARRSFPPASAWITAAPVWRETPIQKDLTDKNRQDASAWNLHIQTLITLKETSHERMKKGYLVLCCWWRFVAGNQWGSRCLSAGNCSPDAFSSACACTPAWCYSGFALQNTSSF